MHPDAQAAADAAMVEITQVEATFRHDTHVVVRRSWLRAFLANFFDEWLTKIGGEQAEVCEWRETSDGIFRTQCGEVACPPGAPGECYCGKPIREVPYEQA